MFNGSVLTIKGQALWAKAQAGTQLNFTKIKIGDTAYSGDLSELNDLIHPIKEVDIEKITVENTQTRIRCTINNVGVLDGYHIRELGIYASDPDEGEILYAVANTADNPADYIPPEASDAVEEIIEFIATVGTAENVNTIIDGSIIYASAEDLSFLTEEVSMLKQEVIPSLSSERLNKDSNDIFTEIQYKRLDGSLFKKSVLSGGVSPEYSTRTVTYYAADGVTMINFQTFNLLYTDGELTSEVIQPWMS